MNRKVLYLWLCLLPLLTWAQDPVYNDRDTANSIPHIGIVGDVVSGYNTTVEATVHSDDKLYR